MSLPAFAQRHRAALYLGVALLTAAGLYAMVTLPAGIYPEATFPRIAVIARGGTFEPNDMVVAVTRPLEEAVSGVIDLRRIRSRTVRGATELNLDFRPGADMPFALQQVQGRISAMQSSLPTGLEILAERLTPSIFPMMQYELTGADPVLLRDLAQYTIRPRLARLPDVGEVGVQGGLVREVSVVLDPTQLVSHRLGVSTVADRIRASTIIEAAGRVDKTYLQYGVIISGAATTPRAVGEIVVSPPGESPVRVADLGSVRYGAEDRFDITTGNGVPAALINISRQPNGNMLTVERAVNAMIDSLRPLLPGTVKLESVYDQAALVRDSIANVRDAMLLGGFLAVLVLLLFLGRLGITLIAAITLPLAIAGTFAGLALFHDSLNLMSLGGLAVAIGLIIDDAVVVVENIERRLGLHPDEPPADVIRRGTEEIFAPVAGSTLTTVVVFTPLGLLEGVVGQFFRSFSLALAVAVLLSLVFAVTVIPALAAHWHERRKKGAQRKSRIPTLHLEGLERRYAGLAGSVIRHRWALYASSAVLVAGLLLAWRSVGTGFLPDMDEGGFILDYWTPTGSSLAETDRQVRVLEGVLRNDPDIQAFTRRTGAELGFFATAPNQGDMTVLLKPRSQRHVTVYQVMNRLRDQLAERVPAVRVEFKQILQDLLGDLTGAAEPVEIKLFHPDLRTAELAGTEVAKAIEPVNGLQDLFDGIHGNLPEVRVDLDPVRVARLGLTGEQVAAQARAALFGAPAGQVREPDRLVQIRARVPDSVRFSPDIAQTLPMVGANGWAQLGSLGRVYDTADASELLRENLRPLVMVTGAVDLEKSNLGAVMSGIKSRVPSVKLPPGVVLEYGGQYAGQRDSFRQLLLVFALAAGAVLLVMVTQFGGFRGPLSILLMAPLGLAGAIGALVITGVPFNVSSFMGLILLVGLVVKNGIILLDAAMGFREAGATPAEALEHAGRLRLRPILMTTLCTLAGLVPLALGFGAGAELQKPLAIAVIGGLSLSTLVTLVLLPAAIARSGALDAVSGKGER
jgi:CzcA family heavy metal efflux pump